MARRTGAPARSLAPAKATEAVARRGAERIAREKAIQAALVDFFQAQGEVERIRIDAERAAEPFDAATGDAVRTLDRLGETRAGITSLTGVPLTRVREYGPTHWFPGQIASFSIAHHVPSATYGTAFVLVVLTMITVRTAGVLLWACSAPASIETGHLRLAQRLSR